MSFKLGNTSISELYVGSTRIGSAYLGSTKVYDAGSISGEVLYYDNNSYSRNGNSWYNILTNNVTPTRKYVVVMFDQTASSVTSAWASGVRFKFNDYWTWRSHYSDTGNHTGLRSSTTYTAIDSNVKYGTGDGGRYYYCNSIALNTLKTYKYIIDTSSSSNNVKQYLNTSSISRTLMGTDSMSCSGSITELSFRNEVSGRAVITVSNIRIAQFDDELDAVAYNGEQTV